MIWRGRRCREWNNATRGTQKAREGNQSEEKLRVQGLGFKGKGKKTMLNRALCSCLQQLNMKEVWLLNGLHLETRLLIDAALPMV
jgi:hypothetical protein